MLNFNGEFEINSDIERAYNILSDYNNLIKLIPDLIEYHIEENRLKITAKAGVSFIKGKFNLEISYGNNIDNKRIEITAKGSGSGVSVDFKAYFDYSGNNPVNVKYSADVNIAGAAAAAGSRMIKGSADKYINRLISNYRQAAEN
ncbi:SRPBCC family protein [Picrophilus oshimae]|uniref:Carbon monoxide dehydrogenase subunit G n=1 Tax=Picrophilus torridus (strain ATCC 700027 / DSM 9790 / JCM 10055 / NBRC 100828 / KAW 2/3) TaxID=1122961 RepID=Q6KYX9_PICTO|nr:carbon monoxide dehydrogenase subunit G [Picrophilus oshimae]AAT44073.1 CoxG protein [Picrophilus oshimae DSM 9789]SMD30858.1 Carbon monoxide dehydrogenase subunit G [Picrophilus oshimae DSM 9789]